MVFNHPQKKETLKVLNLSNPKYTHIFFISDRTKVGTPWRKQKTIITR